MDKLLAISCAVVAVVFAFTAFPESGSAALIVVICSLFAIFMIRRFSEDKLFLIRIFLLALIARVIFASVIYSFDLYDFFGPDARGYDELGQRLVEVWFGQANLQDSLTIQALSVSGPGWGMSYITGFFYLIVGRNMLAVQSFSAVIGAATVPLIYVCAKHIYSNRRVARISAVLVALFPSFIVWSAQMLKDGFIIFLLVLVMVLVLQLQRKFSVVAIFLLIFSLFGIISLRFYIFYMVAAAIAGSFIIGISKSKQSLLRRSAAVVLVGMSLTYLGVVRTVTVDFERFGTIDRLQISRQSAAVSSESGFADDDWDVSTAGGALSALPTGLAYLMLAPFPWQVSNFRQASALPEVFLWWAMIPLIVSGLWFTLKNRLRSSIGIVIFSLMLTLVYALYQGNVGTAYRQRTQIQVFLFIFAAAGITMFLERRENKKAMIDAHNIEFERRLGFERSRSGD